MGIRGRARTRDLGKSFTGQTSMGKDKSCSTRTAKQTPARDANTTTERIEN